MSESGTSLTRGPWAYENWLAERRGVPPGAAKEYPLFTDAQLVGEQSPGVLGPYHLLNMLAPNGRAVHAPSAVLRVALHPGEVRPLSAVPELGKTDTTRYHGGGIQDEVAAVVSLALGMRLKAGGETRVFAIGDPVGRPCVQDAVRDPLPLVPPEGTPRVLPRAATEEFAITRAHPIVRRLPEVAPDDATAFVRAAKLYQDALWIVETQPELSWLMLVSALEVAANRWDSRDASSVELLGAHSPELADELRRASPGLLESVASWFANSLGSTRKFRDFALAFMPHRPDHRPGGTLQLAWTHAELGKALSCIYGHRSKALHRGIPFPLPMCMPPMYDGKTPAEVPPPWCATISPGVAWERKDTPMLLHTFEYIARKALLKWWNGLPRVADGTPADEAALELQPPPSAAERKRARLPRRRPPAP